MDPREVRELYDPAYAETYDARFLLPPWGRKSSEFELGIIRRKLGEHGSYLDVACGTGWFLSQFAGQDRAGLDLSEAMLAQARRSNPDALLRQGDFREDQHDWHDRWDLVSCMWFAYCYAETVDEVEVLLANMARWTSPRGAVFIPICDAAALGLDDIPYKSGAVEFGGEMRITSLNWTWCEPGSGKLHRNLVAPHEDHIIELLSTHFREVARIHYPSVVLDAGGEHPWVWKRKAVLAESKRQPGDSTPSEVRDVPAPECPASEPPATGRVATDPPTRHSVSFYRRARTGGRRLLLSAVQAAERRLGG